MNTEPDKNSKSDCSAQSHAKKKYVRPELVKKQILPQVTQGSAHRS